MPASACPRCGQALDPSRETTRCPRCGAPLPIPLGAARATGSGVGSSVRIPIPQPPESKPQEVPDPSPAEPVKPADGQHLVRRLKVIDGADQGHSYLLPDTGVVTVGSNQKHAEVCLHDLYVGRVHCQIQVDGDELLVTSCESAKPTFINGKAIQQDSLAPGDVLRVGNSYLRLELEVGDVPPPAAPSRGPAHAPTAAPAAPKTLPRLTLPKLAELSGYTLGHFQIGKVLGHGQYGVVFRATDLKSETEVALKVISPDFPANETELRQFGEAMRAALGVQHANLVTTWGVGKSGPYCWIARELVAGLSLAQMLPAAGKTREGLDWRLALRVGIHVARALDEIHRHRLVHHNVTPQNILLEGDDGDARLNDVMFGKAIEGSLLWHATRDRKRDAEIAYLAPEQTYRDSFVDQLCDVYSLGVVLYVLLTGRLPFRGKTAEETLEQIREEVPQKPKKYQKSVPTLFQEVVLKMMAKHQEDRYATAGELLADLDRLANLRNVEV